MAQLSGEVKASPASWSPVDGPGGPGAPPLCPGLRGVGRQCHFVAEWILRRGGATMLGMQNPALPELDQDDTRPLNQQIADILRLEIDSGRLPPGARVPGENTLMSTYGVARWTAREALAVLARAGLITKVPGAGTFVRELRRLERRPRRYRRRSQQAAPFATDVQAANMKPLIEAESVRVEATPEIAEVLALEVGAAVMRTQYRFLADGKPVQTSVSYEPLSLTAGTDVEVPEEGPLAGSGVIARMDSLGIEIARVSEEIAIRPPGSDEAALLSIPDGIHVFDIQRTFFTEERPVETARIVIPGDRYSLVYTFRVTEDDDPVTE